MPELAEVVFHASQWGGYAGKIWELVRLNEKSRCCRGLDVERSRTVLAKTRLEGHETHGKRMLFRFSQGAFLEVHLGMTGRLTRDESGYALGKHDHLVFKVEGGFQVFCDPRMFGKLALHETDGDLPDWWRALPPQPQDAAFDRERFDVCAKRCEGSVVKAALLKQELFPGVGNWMADEILWRARIRPERRMRSLSEAERSALFTELRWVCKEAIRIIGSDYSDPPESWLFLHRWKDGGVCPKTSEPLARDTVGGRTTCWSPQWQV